MTSNDFFFHFDLFRSSVADMMVNRTTSMPAEVIAGTDSKVGINSKQAAEVTFTSTLWVITNESVASNTSSFPSRLFCFHHIRSIRKKNPPFQ